MDLKEKHVQALAVGVEDIRENTTWPGCPSPCVATADAMRLGPAAVAADMI
jgi:hypothetical protein